MSLAYFAQLLNNMTSYNTNNLIFMLYDQSVCAVNFVISNAHFKDS